MPYSEELQMFPKGPLEYTTCSHVQPQKCGKKRLFVENKEFKRGSLFFDSCVNATERWPYWLSRMEASYCTFGLGTIIRHDLHTLSLPRNSPCDNLYACVIWVHAEKATHAKQNYLTGLATKKSGGTITHLHTWRQDGRHNRFPL